MNRSYSLIDDLIFYITVGFFALLTTGLPLAIGQPNFLPIIQTLALFVFLLIPARKGLIPQTLLTLGIWVVTQFVLVTALTWLMQGRIERAFHDGFQYRMDMLAWLYSASLPARPDSFTIQPLARVIEVLGIVIGSVISGGLIGIWFLMRSVNLAGFSTGIALAASNGLAVLFAFPLWTLCRLAGYTGLVALLSEPLLRGAWAPTFYWRNRQRLIVTALGLLALGLLLELFLPGLWRTLYRSQA